MKPLPSHVRLAALLPAPFSLSDYEPFVALGASGFGLAELEDVTAVSYAALQKAMAKAVASGATVGYSPVAKVRAVFFDMDSTVIEQESIVELAAFAGKAQEVAEVTEAAMRGEIDFKAALAARVALLDGLPVEIFDEVADRLTLCRGIQRFVSFCRELSVPTFLASGGFVPLAAAIQRKVGFEAVLANTLGVAGGRLTGRVEGPVVDADAKRAFLLDQCRRLGIDPAQTAAVGDGANDIPMLNAAGVAIGFRPKAALLPHVHAVNAVGNHAFLGPLLFGRDLMITRSRRTS